MLPPEESYIHAMEPYIRFYRNFYHILAQVVKDGFAYGTVTWQLDVYSETNVMVS